MNKNCVLAILLLVLLMPLIVQGEESVLYLPNSLKSIKPNAFLNCEDLKSVIIEQGLNSIEDYAFKNCYNLESITIPDTVVQLGTGIFENDDKLIVYCKNNTKTADYCEREDIRYIDNSRIGNQYTAVFFNEDGTEICRITDEYGKEIESTIIPYKEPKYEYAFDGWIKPSYPDIRKSKIFLNDDMELVATYKLAEYIRRNCKNSSYSVKIPSDWTEDNETIDTDPNLPSGTNSLSYTNGKQRIWLGSRSSVVARSSYEVQRYWLDYMNNHYETVKNISTPDLQGSWYYGTGYTCGTNYDPVNHTYDKMAVMIVSDYGAIIFIKCKDMDIEEVEFFDWVLQTIAK